jgi:hypothetical protein
MVLFNPKKELNVHEKIFLSAFAWAVSVSITIIYQKKILKDQANILELTLVAFTTTSIALYITYFLFGTVV